MRRVGDDGNETFTIPNHRELDAGTCKAIFRQASQYVPEAELYPYFYS
ncbi:type II toxin-antitoxin system HicA family toxin [Phormidesmis sp. 146-33]